MYSESIKAALSAARQLFRSWSTLLLLAGLYAGLLVSLYLFVSTREATVSQLLLTLALTVIAPALFFGVQAVSVNYANGPSGLIRKAASDFLKLIVVTVPLVALTALALYGLGKIQTQPTVVTAIRYLLGGVIAPLLAIQLWVAVSRDGLRSLLGRLRNVVVNAFAPQSVFVYACGLLFFGVAPYLLIFASTASERAWLEISLFAFRLLVSAVLILLGWVTTVGALSILSRPQQQET